MPTILEVKAETLRLEAEARALASKATKAGQQPAAREIAAINGETARLVIALAEKRAGLMSRDVIKRGKRELAEIESDVIEEIEGLGDTTRISDIADGLSEAAHHGVARVDRHQELFRLQIAEHARDVWRQALADLAPLVPPCEGEA
jgi:Skp family chaperone for outer membrane proteins